MQKLAFLLIICHVGEAILTFRMQFSVAMCLDGNVSFIIGGTQSVSNVIYGIAYLKFSFDIFQLIVSFILVNIVAIK